MSLPTVPPNKRRQRATHPPCIGAGQIGARDQRIGGKRAPLIGPQRLALPFRRLALGRGQPGARHRDLDRPERACQRPRAAAVAMARNAGSFFIAGHLASFVTRPCQRSIEFAAKQLFNELTRPSPYLGLDRVEPVVEKIEACLGGWLQRIRLRGSVRHGVVSSPTLQRRMIRGFDHPGDYANLNSYQLRDGTDPATPDRYLKCAMVTLGLLKVAQRKFSDRVRKRISGAAVARNHRRVARFCMSKRERPAAQTTVLREVAERLAVAFA